MEFSLNHEARPRDPGIPHKPRHLGSPQRCCVITGVLLAACVEYKSDLASVATYIYGASPAGKGDIGGRLTLCGASQGTSGCRSPMSDHWSAN